MSEIRSLKTTASLSSSGRQLRIFTGFSVFSCPSEILLIQDAAMSISSRSSYVFWLSCRQYSWYRKYQRKSIRRSILLRSLYWELVQGSLRSSFFYNTRTVVLFASVLIVPIMFISDTLSNVIMIMLNTTAFIIVNAPVLEPDIYSWSLTNLIIFSTVGIMIGYFVNRARFERYVFAESAIKLAELQTRYAYYDQFTGLQNRRGYAEKIDELTEKLPENCFVVMADINGLKEANDNFGHDASDELITASANSLCEAFGKEASIYRLGGDEFGVITLSNHEDMEKRMRKLEEITSAYDGREIHGVSISAGFAGADEFPDIDSIPVAADERMYKEKSDYYIRTGKDRRK